MASNDVQQQRRAAEDVEGNFVAMQVSPASPRMNQRPLSYASEFLSVPQRLSRLTEIEEDERSNMDVASIVDAHHPTLAFPASCDPKPEGGDFRLPLDLGSNFNVNSFPLYEYAGVRTPDDFRFPRIGRVSQTSYFQPAALRQLSEHSDKSPSTADLEITFPMPPRPSSPGKLATSKRSFDELSLSAVIGGGMHASPKFESEAGKPPSLLLTRWQTIEFVPFPSRRRVDAKCHDTGSRSRSRCRAQLELAIRQRPILPSQLYN